MSVNIDDDVVDVISCVASFLRKEKFRAQLPRKERTLKSVRKTVSSVLFPIPSIKLLLSQVARLNFVIHVRFLVDPTQILLPMNMVGTSVLRKLRMRKQNTKTTVPLDVAPERRTKRCSPRFRPGGRFCESRFRYQSSPTGIEGEISRPLDHM